MSEPTPSSQSPLADIASCVDGFDPHALRVGAAKAFIARLVQPVDAVEQLPIRSALGRVLAEDIVSPIDVPAHDNSAMDGYAVRGDELRADEATVFRVVGKSFAGDASSSPVGANECVRIMTGAVMPPGLDTVVPQELVTLGGGGSADVGRDATNVRSARFDSDAIVTVRAGAVRRGDNRRLRGEDLSLGGIALRAGRTLRPADLGLLASLGRVEVQVMRRVRVAFFSTGDELRSLGETLDAGCVYDSNRYTLWAMLQRLGVDAIDMGVVRDDPVALAKAFTEAAACADVVITSGGVSVGEADHTKKVMAELGDVLFWSVAMRPGRPLAIGRIATGRSDRSALLFGLPGNPVAVMVTFYALVRDALLQMSGAAETASLAMRIPSRDAIRKKPGRTEYQRAIVTRRADGTLQVSVLAAQGSGVLRSMSEANALAVLSHDQAAVAPGDVIDVLMFDGLV
jgi:molybdopterin molybdotransferase